MDNIADFVDTKIGDGHEIFLMLNANKDLRENGPWTDVIKQCDLYDLMEKQKEENLIPVSQEGSEQRINYIMETEKVYEATISTCVNQINSGVSSNH